MKNRKPLDDARLLDDVLDAASGNEAAFERIVDSCQHVWRGALRKMKLRTSGISNDEYIAVVHIGILESCHVVAQAPEKIGVFYGIVWRRVREELRQLNRIWSTTSYPTTNIKNLSDDGKERIARSRYTPSYWSDPAGPDDFGLLYDEVVSGDPEHRPTETVALERIWRSDVNRKIREALMDIGRPYGDAARAYAALDTHSSAGWHWDVRQKLQTRLSGLIDLYGDDDTSIRRRHRRWQVYIVIDGKRTKKSFASYTDARRFRAAVREQRNPSPETPETPETTSGVTSVASGVASG